MHEKGAAMVPGLVSVVIPTYNQRALVGETLDSVLCQSYQQLEIIVTDDGSSDGTAEIIKEFARKHANIIPILHLMNSGIAANMNGGLRIVRGEFIAWLGGDDIMFRDKLAKQVEALRNRADAVGCCHDAEVFESPSGRVLGPFSEVLNGKRGFREGGVELWFDRSYFMLPSTMMVRSSAVPAHGFDERVRFANDWLLDVETFRNGKCIVINEILGRYRRHGGNVTGSQEAQKFGSEDGLVALAIAEARYPELSRLCRNRRAVFFLSAAVNAHRCGQGEVARQFVRAAMRHGAYIRGIVLWCGILLFGDYIAQESAQLNFRRSALSKWLIRFVHSPGGGWTKH
jgi:glycosyltransferase involved in cell wall biosynthesis